MVTRTVDRAISATNRTRFHGKSHLVSLDSEPGCGVGSSSTGQLMSSNSPPEYVNRVMNEAATHPETTSFAREPGSANSMCSLPDEASSPPAIGSSRWVCGHVRLSEVAHASRFEHTSGADCACGRQALGLIKQSWLVLGR